MTTAPPRRPIAVVPDRDGRYLLWGYGILFGPIAVGLLLTFGTRLASDPGTSTAGRTGGVLMLLVVAALPAGGVLLLGRRRADRAWTPAMTARSRTPFTPEPPDLVLTQAPGRLVAGITATWPVTVGLVVLALGHHPLWWIAVAAGLTVIARMTWRLRTRPVLSVSADGFEIACGWRRLTLAWYECDAFTATPRGQVKVSVVPDLGLKPPPAHAIRAGLDRRSAEELAALLTSYLRPAPPRA